MYLISPPTGWSFRAHACSFADGKPAGQLIYKDLDGDVVAICFMKDDSVAERRQF